MQLPAELVEQVAGCIGIRLDRYRNGAVRDKRRAPRFPLSARTLLYRFSRKGIEAATKARIRDISTASIGLLSSEPLLAGETFLIALPNGNGPRHWVLCTVARQIAVERGTYLIGATFTRMLARKPAVRLSA